MGSKWCKYKDGEVVAVGQVCVLEQPGKDLDVVDVVEVDHPRKRVRVVGTYEERVRGQEPVGEWVTADVIRRM